MIKSIVKVVIKVFMASLICTAIVTAMLFDSGTINVKRAVIITFLCYIFFFGNLAILWKLDNEINPRRRLH